MSGVLRLDGVAHRHPGAPQQTLVDVDLEVAAGELVAVLGPSGSGKSTLLRVAAGLEAPSAGDVLIDGRSVLGVPPEGRDLTVMFQQPHLFPHLSVIDNVAFADRLRGHGRAASRTAARRYLDLVHLGDLASRRPRQLSGGQEQRVALARALAAERRVLLLDEPFSALDTDLRGAMHQLLGEVRERLEPTVVMVTHDLDEAALADRVAVLVGGRLEQVGEVADLWTAPRTLAVARLVGGFVEVPGQLTGQRHRSVLGDLELPDDVSGAGPAALLLRKERLALVEPATGPGALAGRVTGVRHSGPHLDVEVALDGAATGVVVVVQARLGSALGVGERTGVRLPGPQDRWAVSLSPED